MKPSLTAVEAVAWDRLAQAFDYYHRTGQHAVDPGGAQISPYGLCWGIDLFPEQIEVSARQRCRTHLPPKKYGEGDYCWPRSRRAARSLAAFCRRMAAQCRSEL